MKPSPCAIGVSDHAGWAYFVCVAAPGGVPAVVGRRRATLIDAGLPAMPYHHDTLTMSEDAANALIARVRGSIAACASRALADARAAVSPAHAVVAIAVRELTFGELPASVGPVRRSYQLQCAADGMMYPLALCEAARTLGLDVHRCPRGEEAARAAAALHTRVDDVESFVAATGRPSGPPWAVEHRRAFAAAMAALASHTPLRLAAR